MFTKCTTAYLLEANVASLSMKQTSYIIIVVYPYGGMQKVWKLSIELCGLLFLHAVNKSNHNMDFTQMMMTIDVN